MSALCDSPLFIIGNPRSGTTLLRLMLTCHPRLVIPPEAGFALWLHETYRDWQPGESATDSFLSELMETRKFETWNLTAAAIKTVLERTQPQSYAELVSAVYQTYLESIGKPEARWGDKNNYYLEHIVALDQLFPKAQYIHIIRDPRDVACSYIEINKRDSRSIYAPKLPSDVGEIAESWRDNIRRIRQSFQTIGGQKVHELRFEDLVEESEATLREACTFLGESFDEEMLDYHSKNRELGLEPEEFLDWKALTVEQPRAERVGVYRQDLSNEQIETIEGLTVEERALYGYDRVARHA